MNKVTHGNWITITEPEGYGKDFDHDLKYLRKTNNLPSDKTDIRLHCYVPWQTINIDHKGRIFLCNCDGWLPYSVGHVLDFNSIDEIFNSDTAKLIHKSIIEKKYTYCVTNSCGIKNKNYRKYENSIDLMIGLDPGCNLSCPSCRERVILDNSKEFVDERNLWSTRICSWIAGATNTNFNILVGSNGDPFVSNVYLNFLNLIDKFENISLSIKTNGLYIEKRLTFTLQTKVKLLSISIDAATKNTYELVRRGANWNTLLKNLEYCKSLKENQNIQLIANFVVQKSNFIEMKDFVHFCRNYNMKISFSHLSDWGTWHVFSEQCVHTKESPYYAELKEILKDPIFNGDDISMGILKHI
jgi:MoaA/NifB/PqqE/SkfB family radical SAM enzyme